MAETEFPVLLAGNMLSLLPAAFTTRSASLVLRRLERQHPRLFATLAAHPPAAIGIEPTDLPHRFLLRFGGHSLSLAAVPHFTQTPNAIVRGRLAALVALLEGRLDSDAAFFARDIIVTGNTEAIVSLRNALERDEVDLFASALDLFGPGRRMARRAMLALERGLAFARRRAVLRHEALHAERQEKSPLAAHCARLEQEFHALSARVSRIEVLARRRGQIGKAT